MLDANAYEANIGRTFRITQLDMDMITLDVDMITLDGILQTLALDPVYATTKIYVGSMHSDMIYIYILIERYFDTHMSLHIAYMHIM